MNLQSYLIAFDKKDFYDRALAFIYLLTPFSAFLAGAVTAFLDAILPFGAEDNC